LAEVIAEGAGHAHPFRRRAGKDHAWVQLLAGDLAHGIVEGQTEDLDVKVFGVAGEAAGHFAQTNPSFSRSIQPTPFCVRTKA
jgi:hypothetical protein